MLSLSATSLSGQVKGLELKLEVSKAQVADAKQAASVELVARASAQERVRAEMKATVASAEKGTLGVGSPLASRSIPLALLELQTFYSQRRISTLTVVRAPDALEYRPIWCKAREMFLSRGQRNISTTIFWSVLHLCRKL